MAQHHLKQSLENEEVVKRIVEDLFKFRFIVKVKYTTWVSNVVLMKNSNNNWHMRKFFYKVMPSSLKNARATYQIMMNMIFKGQISDMQEI